MRVRFLGTGASGGTPGEGRSARRESSALVADAGVTVLVDATRHLDEQLPEDVGLDAVVLTHGHRDASGGIPALRRRPDRRPVRVFAHPRTHRVLRGRSARLDHVELVDVRPGEQVALGPIEATAVEVPHAWRDRFPTYAWRFASAGHDVVYASDVAELTEELEHFAEGADLLVLDGAMYGQSIFTHLRIEEAVPIVCTWDVHRVLLTQIGRSVPPHHELTELVHQLCARAAPAYDGLAVEVGS